MKNRRLLTILIIFVVLATFAVLGGVLLTVRTVEIKFMNELVYYKDKDDSLAADLKKAADPLILGRNGLFSINRTNVENAMQASVNRIRVTNIEYKFPSTYVISVRERYPVFKLKIDENKTAILCGYLRVLEIVNEKVEDVKNVQGADGWELIDITGQTDFDAENLHVTDDLTKLDTNNPYIKILKELTPFFAENGSKESEICSIFESIEFDRLTDETGGLILVLRSRRLSETGKHFDIAVWNAENRFLDKLEKGWDAVEYNLATHNPGLYQVKEVSTSVSPDGLAVPFSAGKSWEDFLEDI